MRNLLNHFTRCFFLCLAICLFLNPTQAEPIQGRTVYVTEVPKYSVQRFLDRFATPQSQIVLTNTPVPGANSFTLHEDAGFQLFVLEMFRPGVSKLPGELLRLNRFAFLSIPRGNPVLRQLVQSPLFKIRPIDTIEQSYLTTQNSFLGLQNFTPNSTQFIIDPDFLKQKLSEFSGALPIVINGLTTTISERGSLQGKNLARAYLAQEYTKLGFRVTQVPYKSGINFVAEKAGQDSTKFVIVSAHLDSVGNAGADDDGAGTISALAVAQALAPLQLKYTLKIVGFDQEENGLVGSKAYAAQLQEAGQMQNLMGVFNLEMTGYNGRNDGGFHVIDCNENTSNQLSQMLLNIIAQNKIQLMHVNACTSRSDHATFWKYNKPAVVIAQNFFGGDSNPCYHQSCDTVKNLNFNYMARITQAVALTLAGFLK